MSPEKQAKRHMPRDSRFDCGSRSMEAFAGLHWVEFGWRSVWERKRGLIEHYFELEDGKVMTSNDVSEYLTLVKRWENGMLPVNQANVIGA